MSIILDDNAINHLFIYVPGTYLPIFLYVRLSIYISICSSIYLYIYQGTTEEKKVSILDNFLDLGRNTFPDNLFQAAFLTVAEIDR